MLNEVFLSALLGLLLMLRGTYCQITWNTNSSICEKSLHWSDCDWDKCAGHGLFALLLLQDKVPACISNNKNKTRRGQCRICAGEPQPRKLRRSATAAAGRCAALHFFPFWPHFFHPFPWLDSNAECYPICRQTLALLLGQWDDEYISISSLWLWLQGPILSAWISVLLHIQRDPSHASLLPTHALFNQTMGATTFSCTAKKTTRTPQVAVLKNVKQEKSCNIFV